MTTQVPKLINAQMSNYVNCGEGHIEGSIDCEVEKKVY